MHSNEKGMTFIVEIVLVAIVLTAAAFAVYTAANKGTASVSTPSPSPTAITSPTPTTDPTMGWKAYTSIAGRYELKHPASWVVSTCEDRVFFATSEEGLGKIGKCAQTDAGPWPQMGIITRDIGDGGAALARLNQIPDNEKVIVAGVQGRRQTHVAAAPNSDPVYQAPEGTVSVVYTFKTKVHVYEASYYQYSSGAASADLKKDFDRMLQQTFKD